MFIPRWSGRPSSINRKEIRTDRDPDRKEKGLSLENIIGSPFFFEKRGIFEPPIFWAPLRREDQERPYFSPASREHSEIAENDFFFIAVERTAMKNYPALVRTVAEGLDGLFESPPQRFRQKTFSLCPLRSRETEGNGREKGIRCRVFPQTTNLEH